MRIVHPNVAEKSLSEAAFAAPQLTEVFNKVIVPEHISGVDFKTRCLRYIHVLGAKVCVAWGTYQRTQYQTCYLVVDAIEAADVEDELRDAILDCLRRPEMVKETAALIAAYASGVGTVATTAITGRIVDMLVDCLGEEIDLADIRIDCEQRWGDWFAVKL